MEQQKLSLAIYQKVKDAFITEGSIGKAGSLCKIKLVDEDLNEVSIEPAVKYLLKVKIYLNAIGMMKLLLNKV